MKIVIKTIPAKKHRYWTVGDYWIDKDQTIQMRITDMNNFKAEMLVAIHELIEMFLSKAQKVSFKAIDEFDIEWDKHPSRFKEPGDDPKAPYHKQHMIANLVERLLTTELDMIYDDYDDRVAKAAKEYEEFKK